MTGILLRSWRKCQASVVNKVEWQRKKRVEDGSAAPDSLRNPLSINSISIASVLDDDFAKFAEMVGGKYAETYLVRVLQYVANGHALTGEINVSPSKFGTLVLSREWDIVSPGRGRKVYEALIESGIALPTSGSSRGSTGGSSDGSLARAFPSLPVQSIPDQSSPGRAGLVLVGSLSEAQRACIAGILDALCRGEDGKENQDSALHWRKLFRSGGLEADVGKQILGRWLKRFPGAARKGKEAAGLTAPTNGDHR